MLWENLENNVEINFKIKFKQEMNLIYFSYFKNDLVWKKIGFHFKQKRIDNACDSRTNP